MKLLVNNIKCGGCAKTIENQLNNIANIQNVEVNVEEGSVSFTGADESKVKAKLKSLGYPLADDKNSMIDQAKSYVSCAVGRMS